MLHYILQILAFQTLFLLIYDLFHKEDTFFNWNRFYLLFTPVLSLVLPFIKLEIFRNQPSQIVVTQVEEVITLSSDSLVILGTTGPEENPINWWVLTYFIGFGISLLILAFKLYKLKVLTSFSFISNINNKKVITLPNSHQAFSFWNTIYIGDQLHDQEKKQILIHELIHVEQKHSLDQIWFEILKTFFWWNPLVYIYQSRMTVLHEYIADEAVTKMINKRSYIDQLLNSVFQTQEISFVNQFFNHSLIKKRILMLQKPKSKSVMKFKYLLLVPSIVGILTYTSCKAEGSDTNTIENTDNPNYVGLLSTNEPECPNKNSEYDKELDNYLKLTSGDNEEVIIDIISQETSKKIRTVHLTRNQTYRTQNIPEGVYQLLLSYGDGYAEKTVDNECVSYFEKPKAKELSHQILDFTTIVTSTGRNVPSYSMDVYLKDPQSPEQNLMAKVQDTVKKGIPFAALDKVPSFESCQEFTDNSEIKKCVSQKIQKIVATNFKTEVLAKKGLIGTVKMYVRFKIDTTGNIVDIKARGPLPEAEAEAKRAITKIPQMIPGEQNGKKVNVLYSLPIVAMIKETGVKMEKEKQEARATSLASMTDAQVLTENLGDYNEHNIKSGYYLVTSIFKSPSYFEKGLNNLKKIGLPAKGFKNPKDGYYYAYLERYDSLEKAKEMLLNNFNDQYFGDTYILKIITK